MTHEELLAKIGKPADEGYEYCDIVFNRALRAVVELHKPIKDEFFNVGELICEECTREEYTNQYPCPTIEAIEKELQ